AGRLHLDLDFLVVELARAQPFAERLLGRGAGVLAHQGGHHPILGGELGARAHVLAFSFPGLRDRDFHEVAHDLLDIAPDITDLGKFGRCDLDERSPGELGEAAGNLGFAHAGWADHQDVLGQHLLAHFLVELQAPPAIAQRDRHRPLGITLADDEAVEFGDDFARRKIGHALQTIRRARPSGVSTMRSLWKPAFSWARMARALAGSGSVRTRGVPVLIKPTMNARMKAEPWPRPVMSGSPMN